MHLPTANPGVGGVLYPTAHMGRQTIVAQAKWNATTCRMEGAGEVRNATCAVVSLAERYTRLPMVRSRDEANI